MRVKANILVLVIVMAIVFPLWLHLNSTATKKNKIQFDIFNSSNLSGKISWLYASQGGVRFRLNGAEEIYMFIPRMTALNGYADFGEISETGDSVYKPSFADTLILAKVMTKRVYKFTFKPPS
jgi:hypothetical protein